MKRAHFYAIGFAVLMLADTWTQVAFKLAARRTGEFSLRSAWLMAAVHTPWIYGAIAGYVIAFVTWMTLLEHAPVGPAFAASHLEVVTVLLISIPFFHERLTVLQSAGALCVVSGVMLLSSSQVQRNDV